MRRPEVGIIHLGIGAFWRAFGIPWIEEAMEAEGGEWGVLGVSLRSPRVRDYLSPADFVYTALERGPKNATARTVRALRGVLVAPEDPEAVVDALADPGISMVTLTVTEKGYCRAADGRLDLSHPAIIHEMANPEAPETAPGFIVAALAKRRSANIPPFTCLSCDNLPANGHTLRRVVLDLAQRIDPGLAEWIEAEGAFPCSMVDRIVPATTPDDITEIEQLTGVPGRGSVVHEPFRQWVIEDNFCGPRPVFEAVGVLVAGTVAPFENMKLRCLNGTHSAIAYLGQLGDKTTVAETVGNKVYRKFIEALWREELVPSFAPPAGVDVSAYTQALMERYLNANIRHATIQIAMDGSEKLPQRTLAPMMDLLDRDRGIERLAFVIAGWIHFLRIDPAKVNDPLADVLCKAAQASDPIGSILSLDKVFPTVIAASPQIRSAVQHGFDAIAAHGVIAAMEDLT